MRRPGVDEYGEAGVKSESNASGQWVRVAGTQEVGSQQGHVVQIGKRRLALFEVNGKIVCIDDRCPHAGGRLGEGQVCGSVVHCPRHGWRFDLVDGRCLSDPRFEVQRYSVKIDDGVVFVELPGQE